MTCWEPHLVLTTNGSHYKIKWVKMEEEAMDYLDYVGIAHQIMAMEFGWA